jgi:hypothetical protein
MGNLDTSRKTVGNLPALIGALQDEVLVDITRLHLGAIRLDTQFAARRPPPHDRNAGRTAGLARGGTTMTDLARALGTVHPYLP